MRETGIVLINASCTIGGVIATFIYQYVDNYKDIFYYGLIIPFLVLNITYFFVVESPTYNL